MREFLERKLAVLQDVLMGDPETAKQQIRKYVGKLVMTPVFGTDGSRYEVNGNICLFAGDDKDDVMLQGSIQRTRKQYTALTIPFRTTLHTKGDRGKPLAA